MENTNTGSENIAAALNLLEEAAEQKKDELKRLMSDKYTHLKNAVVEAEAGFGAALSDAKKHAAESAAHAREAGAEKAREMASEVDKSVHQNPWPYIAGSAVIGLLLGGILVRGSK